jgi:hypothetical protein
MNKKLITIVLIVFAIIGVLAIGLYLLISAGQTNTTETTNTQTQNDAVAQNTIKELLGSTSPQQCSYTDPEGVSSGTVYVANGKMAGRFMATTAQGSLTSQMYSDGTDMYIWMDGQPQGIMMSLSAAQNSDTTTTNQAQNIDVNKPFDFNCAPWVVDQTMFAKPTGITFVNMSELIPTGAGSGSGSSPSMPSCSACDMLPQAAQASCRAAIPGCS